MGTVCAMCQLIPSFVPFFSDGAVPLKRGESRQRCSSATTSMLALTDTENQIEYKHGWLMRKSLYDSDGRRSEWLWRQLTFFGFSSVRSTWLANVLRDGEGHGAVFAQGWTRLPSWTISDIFECHPIASFHGRIGGCWLQEEAERVPNSHGQFGRIPVSDQVFFIFSQFSVVFSYCSEPEEVRSWLEAINFVAAAFSMPALPAPTSSQGQAFHKPLLPSAPTRLSMVS